MRVLLNELFRSFQRTTIISILFLIVYTLSIILMFVIYTDRNSTQGRADDIVDNVRDNTIYRIVYMIDEAQMKQIQNRPEIMVELENFRRDLETTSGVVLYNASSMTINAAEDWVKLPESFFINKHGYGENPPGVPDDVIMKPLDFVIVSENYMDVFGLSVASGTKFSQGSSFYQKGKPVDIILGAAFEAYYDIGNTIHFETAYEDITMQVVGFLPPGSIAPTSSSQLISLDDHVLFPGFTDMDPEEHLYDTFYWQFCEWYCSPTVIVQDSNIDMEAFVQELAARYGGFPVDMIHISYANESLVLSYTGQQANLMTSMAGVAIVVIIITVMVLLTVRIRSELRSYAIYLLIGRSPIGIYWMIMIEMIILILISIPLALVVVMPMFYERFPWDWSYQMPRLLKVVGLLLGVVAMQVAIGLRKLKNATLIRRGNT